MQNPNFPHHNNNDSRLNQRPHLHQQQQQQLQLRAVGSAYEHELSQLEQGLTQNFRLAAAHVSSLYKEHGRVRQLAYNQGFVACMEQISLFYASSSGAACGQPAEPLLVFLKQKVYIGNGYIRRSLYICHSFPPSSIHLSLLYVHLTIIVSCQFACKFSSCLRRTLQTLQPINTWSH